MASRPATGAVRTWLCLLLKSGCFNRQFGIDNWRTFAAKSLESLWAVKITKTHA
jgi:hypothetical protein